MYYKTTIPKENVIDKEYLLRTFDMLEEEHKNPNGTIREISLHCKYDFEKDKTDFDSKDLDIYFKVDALTEPVEVWLENYYFEPVDSIPKDVKHILGFDRPLTLRLGLR